MWGFTIAIPKKKFNQVITECLVGPPAPSTNAPKRRTPEKKFKCLGLWDTGATGSFIDRDFAQKAGFPIVGYQDINHAAGTEVNAPVYGISFIIPGGGGFRFLSVPSGKLAGFQMLVGMDVISRGDFLVSSHLPDKILFTFRYPSSDSPVSHCPEVTNGTKVLTLASPPKPKPIVALPKPGRNDPCPCGSGRKYKECCIDKDRA